jgi:hypothetical protein
MKQSGIVCPGRAARRVRVASPAVCHPPVASRRAIHPISADPGLPDIGPGAAGRPLVEPVPLPFPGQ